jgi:hypothetical protein
MAFFAPAPPTPDVPVIGVCEALHNLPKYNGKLVVVGFVGFTFEGSFMDEQCGLGDTTMMDGKQWLSMIAIGSTKHDDTAAIQWDEDALKQKLKQVQRTTKVPQPTGSGLDGSWTAMAVWRLRAICDHLEQTVQFLRS